MKNKTSLKQVIFSGLLCLATLDASASLVIRPKPMDGHQHDRRAGKVFLITGHENSSVMMLTPDLQEQPLDIQNGQITFKPTGKDNYHALIVKRIHNNVEETAIRYVYGFGKPTGRSPSELTALSKSDLEIIPDPLPREHWHYKAGMQAAFIIHYKGEPVTPAKVSLSTSNASILQSNTDSQGRVVFNLPDDFAETLAGNNANKPGEILIHVKHSDNQKQYASWLSADYEVNPAHWRKTDLGIMVASGGFIFGVLMTGLGFRKEVKPTKAAKKNSGVNS